MWLRYNRARGNDAERDAERIRSISATGAQGKNGGDKFSCAQDRIRDGRAGEEPQKTLLSAAGRRTEEESREAQDHHYAVGEKREWVLPSWASDRGQV